MRAHPDKSLFREHALRTAHYTAREEARLRERERRRATSFAAWPLPMRAAFRSHEARP